MVEQLQVAGTPNKRSDIVDMAKDVEYAPGGMQDQVNKAEIMRLQKVVDDLSALVGVLQERVMVCEVQGEERKRQDDQLVQENQQKHDVHMQQVNQLEERISQKLKDQAQKIDQIGRQNRKEGEDHQQQIDKLGQNLQKCEAHTQQIAQTTHRNRQKDQGRIQLLEVKVDKFVEKDTTGYEEKLRKLDYEHKHRFSQLENEQEIA
ncbi:hypothetical protein K491DRAFT_683125 [Lophiostoma macrostomum CBS 122681]|uniref:Uncharacterized protein n=1 Tax=Lophiostoma macrostomum CBS 122681 TaxID=1314788 RepID=A0A6A6STB6_9PLEO|nr:hypothetical protein K491DRAFT_683125 [Lophiostoma macrostomum CBS 122681]